VEAEHASSVFGRCGNVDARHVGACVGAGA
jgi:hypothetical protein